jgi:hypothetical protein
MGGNTYNRNHYSDIDLQQLILKIDGYKSLFETDKTYRTEKEWRANISRHLDADSCNRFYYMLEDNHYCFNCKSKLDITAYSYTGYNRGFSKYCPECTKKGVWRTLLSKESLEKRGKKIAISKKEFYASSDGIETAKENGKKISRSLKKFYETDAGLLARKKSAEINSKIMREKILSGNFTPNSNNRNTHWESFYKNKKYRSSWEALYQYFDSDAEYESLRIPYIFNGKSYIYIVDFINHKTKTVIEVKPQELINDKKTQKKIAAVKEWCNLNNYNFLLANKDYLTSNALPINLNDFDIKTQQKIKKLYEQIKN